MKRLSFHATKPPPSTSADVESPLRRSGHISVHGEERIALHEEFGLLSQDDELLDPEEELLDQRELITAAMPGLCGWEEAEVAKTDLGWFEAPHGATRR
jgi:hypothetical protein